MHPESRQEKFSEQHYPGIASETNPTPQLPSQQIGLSQLMVRFLTQLQERVRHSRYFISYLLAAALVLSVWHSRATHRFSLRAFLVFLALCGLSLIYGRFFIKRTT